jgi:microcystin-dependent protein
MAVTLDAYFPFAAGAGQVTTVAQWEILAPRVGLRNGVVIGDLNEMAVFADATGMQVKVPTGRVVIAGHVGEASTQKALTVSAAHATLTRIDLVVARLDLTNSRIELDVVAGTPGAGVAPALTQTSTVWEIALGRVTVPGADTTIDAGQVLDVRSFARPQGAEIGDGKLVFYNAPANSAEVFFQGQTVSRFTYAALFALFGTTFGPGDGSTTFVLPNLQGGALTVRDPGQTEFDTVGERGGAKSATLTAGQIPPLPFTTGGESNDHVHETLIRKFALDLVTGGGGSQTLSFFSDPNDNVGRGSLVTPDTSGASTAHSHSGVTSSGGSPLSLLSPYAVVNVAVRAR